MDGTESVSARFYDSGQAENNTADLKPNDFKLFSQSTMPNNKRWSKSKQIRSSSVTLNDLPVLVMKYILGQLSFCEIHRMRLVSRRWNEVASHYLQNCKDMFYRNLKNHCVQWVQVNDKVEDYSQLSGLQSSMLCDDVGLAGSTSSMVSTNKKSRSAPGMCGRHHHSSCYVDGAMYIFGGFTANITSYNDLWRFDCANKTWKRIIAGGTLPLPRSYFSLNAYKKVDETTGEVKTYLILYGGVLSDESVSMNERLVSSIHMFFIKENRWILLDVQGLVVKAGGHSAVVVGDELIVGNGLFMTGPLNCESQLPLDQVPVFNLNTHCWSIQHSSGLITPLGRFTLSKYLKAFFETDVLFPTGFRLNNHNLLYIYSPQHVPLEEAYLLTRKYCPLPDCKLCQEQPSKDRQTEGDENSKHNWNWKWIKCSFKTNTLSKNEVKAPFTSSLGELCQIGDLIVFLSVKGIQPRDKRRILQYFNAEGVDGKRQYRLPFLGSSDMRKKQRMRMLDEHKERITRMHNFSLEGGATKYRLKLNLIDTSQVLERHELVHLHPVSLREQRKHEIMMEDSPFARRFFSLVATSHSLLLFGGLYFSGPRIHEKTTNQLYELVSKPEARLL